jgi:hypothetical protein
MRGERTRDLAIGAGYLAAMAVYVYGIVNPGVDGNEAFVSALLVLAGLNLVTGFAIAEPWGVLLPFAAVLLAIPAGYSESSGDGFEIWRSLLLLAFPAALLIVIGSAARSVRARRRALTEPPH